MLHYRVVRSINRGYPMLMLGVYIAAFLAAAALMFIFPPGSLLLLAVGLVSLVFVGLFASLLRAVERLVARSILATGRCPDCDGPAPRAPEDRIAWHCESCGFAFRRSGDPVTGTAP